MANNSIGNLGDKPKILIVNDSQDMGKRIIETIKSSHIDCKIITAPTEPSWTDADEAEFQKFFAELCQARGEARDRGEYIKPIDLDSDNPFGIPYERKTPKVGRNEECPCGSGKKYKKCCIMKE